MRGVGGTWWENRYPGCACDIASHSYQYSFEPNPFWSGFYAPAKEIREYLDGVAEKYGVHRFVKTNHKVTACTWDDVRKKWHIAVEMTNTGERFEENDIDVLVAARGTLNEMSWPDIAGLDTFKGEKMHSAAWNDSYDFRNKTIGIIGGGSSSVQIVPELQKVEGAKLNCFVRNKVWISNRFGDHVMAQMGLDPGELEFSEEKKKQFAANPAEYNAFRKRICDDVNLVYPSIIRDSDMANLFKNLFGQFTKSQLAKRPDLLAAFSPDFGVGCRRLIPGPGYLEALTQENVEFVMSEIDSINEQGIRLKDGRQFDMDVLVCATGFNTSYIPPYPVTGKQGETLAKKFTPYPKTYLTMTVDDIPNYFMIAGPNSSTGSGSLTIMLEAEGDYIVKCIRKLQKEDYVSMMPKRERVQDFSDYVGEYFKKTVYTDGCKSWYKTEGGKGDRISAVWPGSTLQAIEAMRAPRWEDFDFESLHENGLRWLGNGWSICLMEGQGDPSWYLNDDAVDIPPPHLPETDPKHKSHPFSH